MYQSFLYRGIVVVILVLAIPVFAFSLHMLYFSTNDVMYKESQSLLIMMLVFTGVIVVLSGLLFIDIVVDAISQPVHFMGARVTHTMAERWTGVKRHRD